MTKVDDIADALQRAFDLGFKAAGGTVAAVTLQEGEKP
jgi:hypothetical protein